LWEPSRRTKVVLLLCLIALFAAIRFRLRKMPLERDEGEYAYAGQLILQGVPPYKLAYNMKLPGTYAAYALILAVFGQTPAAIHIGLLLLNALTIVAVYVLAAQLFGSMAGLISAATYGILSTSPSVLGLQGHATHFVVLAAIFGLIVLLRAIEQRRLWLFFFSGVLLGLAFLMKQPGIFFSAFAAVYVVRSHWVRRDSWQDMAASVSVLLGGIALPYALTCLILWKAGVFGKFWFWTVSYARQYGELISWKDGLHTLLGRLPGVLRNSVPIWILAAAGVTTFWWKAESCRHRFFTLGFLAFSFLAVCPGFYFREHYFILLLPAVSLLAGIAVRAAMVWLSQRTASDFVRAIPALVFLTAFAVSLLAQQEIFFELDPVSASVAIYGPLQPFAQASAIADYVRRHSEPGARIAVLGSEPEIYFYAQRHSATGYIYMYPLMETQRYSLKMQDEMIAEFETARPEFVAFVRFPVSWLSGPISDDHLQNWMEQYLPERYDSVGVAELTGPDHTEYRWDEEAKSYDTDSPYVIFLFRRHA
jgi:4-amino-4-deoxy-L-arabinose transferase-like glycosyltransferase